MAYMQTSGIFDDIGAGLKNITGTIGSGVSTLEQTFGAKPTPAPSGMPLWEKVAIGAGIAGAAYFLFFRKKSHGGAHSNPRRRRRRLRRR